MVEQNSFSHFVSVFHNRHLPEPEVMLVGYGALIKTYNLQVPTPELTAAISHKHKVYQQDNWIMYSPRHIPEDSLYGHLFFALRHEGVNLSVLERLFNSIEAQQVIDIIKRFPTGTYSRRIWFLYEWLTEKILDLPNAITGKIVNILDPKIQYPGPSRYSKRHRVRNNLPGTREFCPTIRKTPALEQFIKMNLGNRAQSILGSIHPDILMRAAAFMLLKDSKASYAIEGEHPPQTRAERWGHAIGQAGLNELTHEEIYRLQGIIIEDFRFTHHGYRYEGGFIGEHERSTGFPIPDHISARAEDIFSLMEGLIKTHLLLKESSFDAVLAASIIAFGFVFIHPLEDGNGRIHRYLIHHVLAEKKFVSSNFIFPVSSVLLEHIVDYRKILESYSRPLLKLIKWHPTRAGNVEVKNETIHFYRYFDATKQAEFLYRCIQETIDKTLPEEVSFLKKHDAFKTFIKNYIDMPDRMTDLLIRFMIQENGVLSKRARQKEFNALTETEIANLEEKFSDIFSNHNV